MHRRLILIGHHPPQPGNDRPEPLLSEAGRDAEADLYGLIVADRLCDAGHLPNHIAVTRHPRSRRIEKLLASRARGTRHRNAHPRCGNRQKPALMSESLLPSSPADRTAVQPPDPAATEDGPRELLYRPTWTGVLDLLRRVRTGRKDVGVVIAENALIAAIDHRIQAEFPAAARHAGPWYVTFLIPAPAAREPAPRLACAAR